MKRISIMFFALLLVIASCKKPEESTNTSFTMTYNGVTYTEVDEASLLMTFGTISVVGNGAVEFGFTVEGVGEDGSTVNLCPDMNCADMSRVTLDFGAVEGEELFVALSGTLKRTGKKIEVDVAGLSFSGDPRSLTATIVVDKVLF